MQSVPALASPVHLHPANSHPTGRPDFSDVPTDCHVYESPDSWPAWTDQLSFAIPTPVEEAWALGFSLGVDGIPAAPSAHYTAAERLAFIAAHDIGHARFEEDCQRDFQEMEDRLEALFSDPWDLVSEAEQCEAVGSVVARQMAGGR